MYCVKCGVELADSEKKCPLCGTPVFHPDIPRNLSDPPFPPDRRIRPEDVNRSGILFVLTVAALLPALLCLLCDWRINGTLVWSGYAAGAIGLLYIVILLPMWFRHPNPVIFVPVDFVAVGLYLLYINFATGGHWFLSFAFPVTGAIGLLISAAVALTYYLRGGYLYIYGGMLILGGGLAVLIEFLINLTFQIHETLFWSFYPMVAGVVLGLMLIVIAICKPLRRSLHRINPDYIDLYYLHRYDPNTAPGEIARAIGEELKAGTIRAWGVSNYSAEQLSALLAAAREENIPLPSMCQPPLSLLNTGALDALLPLCAQEGIGVIPYQVLQGGILTGKYHAGQQPPAGSRAAEKPDWMKPMTDEVYATLARVEAEAKAAGQSMTQYALAWALRQPAVRCVLLGVKRRAQLEEAAAIF